MTQKTIKSLEKGLDILFLFTEKKPLLTAEEISEISGFPKSTAYRLLNTLKRKGLVEVDSVTGQHKLGVKLLRLHSIILNLLDIAVKSLPYMKKLAEISGETSQLVLLSRNKAICIEKVESAQALRVMPDKGSLIGLHSGASGKAVMAFLNAEEQDRVIKEEGLKAYTRNTITDPVLLKEKLKVVREQGYAFSSGEITLGTNAIAAPIFDFSGRVTASVSLAGPRERFDQQKIVSALPHLIDAAHEISQKLGATEEKTI